jgi:hypothetical protein
MTRALIAVGIFIGGLALGSIAASLVRRRLTGPKAKPETAEVAAAISSLAFWGIVAVGIIGAVSVASPATLKPIPGDLIRYLPKVMVAGLFMIGGRIVGVLAASAVTQAAARATGEQPKALGQVVRTSITAVAALLSLAQLGIDTAVLLMLTGGVILSVSLSFSLLAGLGGRAVAEQIAAGRALRPHLRIGETVSLPMTSGVITKLHPAKVEIRRPDGRSELLAYTELLDHSIVVGR